MKRARHYSCWLACDSHYFDFDRLDLFSLVRGWCCCCCCASCGHRVYLSIDLCRSFNVSSQSGPARPRSSVHIEQSSERKSTGSTRLRLDSKGAISARLGSTGQQGLCDVFLHILFMKRRDETKRDEATTSDYSCKLGQCMQMNF